MTLPAQDPTSALWPAQSATPEPQPAAPPAPPQPPRPAPPTQAASQPPSAAPVNGKPSTLTIVALAVAGLSLILAVIGVGVGVSAQARSTQLQAQVDELAAQQAEVDGALADLDQRTGTSLVEYLEGLDTRVSDAEATARGAFSRADEAASSASFAEESAYSVGFRLNAVVECVNRYMKTVGDSGGGYYRYVFCR